MFVDNKVVKKFDAEERYDKFTLASTIFDVSFKGVGCSVIESQILKNCDNCNLKHLCKKIDEFIEEYTKKTTVVTGSFSFKC